MSWYAVINKATGELRSTGSSVGEDLPATLAVVEIDEPDFDTQEWDMAGRRFRAKVIRDRAAEFLADPEVAAIAGRLTLMERATLAEKLRKVLDG
jgi:hypothetical protein